MVDSSIDPCEKGLFGKKAGSPHADPRQQILCYQQNYWGLSAGKVLAALSVSALGEMLSDFPLCPQQSWWQHHQ